MRLHVTPLAGVWIEIMVSAACDKIPKVTPLAGVWIEMSIGNDSTKRAKSHSLGGSVD